MSDVEVQQVSMVYEWEGTLAYISRIIFKAGRPIVIGEDLFEISIKVILKSNHSISPYMYM